MAGVPGFEPGMPVSKTGALTTWLYPIIITDFLKEEYLIYGRRDLNSHTLRRQNLNLVRLPISPLPLLMVATTGIEPMTPAL